MSADSRQFVEPERARVEPASATCRLLIEITVGRAPKFVSIGYFCGHLVTIALLIELYPVVPFPSLVTL